MKSIRKGIRISIKAHTKSAASVAIRNDGYIFASYQKMIVELFGILERENKLSAIKF